MFSSLQGYRSYIIAFLLIVLAGLRALNYINDQIYQTALAVLAGGGLAALRAAVKPQ